MKAAPELLFLEEVRLFDGLSKTDLASVLEKGYIHQLDDGEYFFHQEDPANRIYVLFEGKAKLSQLTPEGDQIILGYIGLGQSFGVIALLKDMTYPVSAQAVLQCKALVWDRETLHQLVERNPKIALNTLHILATQIRNFQQKIRELSTQRVERRIARTLLRLAQQTGVKTEVGVLIDLPLARQDLAEMTGTTLYTVSRTLKKWEKQGLIQSGRETVIILFPHGLVRVAEDLPTE
jgi:CRP-like cAMP-binding protein